MGINSIDGNSPPKPRYSGAIDGMITTSQEIRELKREIRRLADSGKIDRPTAMQMLLEIRKGELSYNNCVTLWSKTNDENLKKELLLAVQNGNGLKINEEALIKRDPKVSSSIAKTFAPLDGFLANQPQFLEPKPPLSPQANNNNVFGNDLFNTLMPPQKRGEPLLASPKSNPDESLLERRKITDYNPPQFREELSISSSPSPPRIKEIESESYTGYFLSVRIKNIAYKHFPRAEGFTILDIKGTYEMSETGIPRNFEITAITYRLPNGKVVTITKRDSKILTKIENELNGKT